MIKPEKALRLSIALILLTVIFSGFLYHIFNIDSMNLLDRTQLCIFRMITGKKCPGCGMTHAFLSIGKLQFINAVKYNIFAVPFFLVMTLFMFQPKIKQIFDNKLIIYSLLLVAIVYWVVRNL